MESLFFWTSKLAWMMIAPDNLILFLLLIAWILLWRGAYRPATWLLGTVTTVLMLVALFPVGEWLLYPLETRFAANPKLPDRIDGIIVLSGTEDAVRSSLWQQVELHDSAEREMAFLELARRYPNARLVFTGGSGSMVHQDDKAADVARKLFDNLGLDLSRVTFERNSRNTYENAVMSRELVRPDSAQTWVLITTAWHLPGRQWNRHEPITLFPLFMIWSRNRILPLRATAAFPTPAGISLSLSMTTNLWRRTGWVI